MGSRQGGCLMSVGVGECCSNSTDVLQPSHTSRWQCVFGGFNGIAGINDEGSWTVGVWGVHLRINVIFIVRPLSQRSERGSSRVCGSQEGRE